MTRRYRLVYAGRMRMTGEQRKALAHIGRRSVVANGNAAVWASLVEAGLLRRVEAHYGSVVYETTREGFDALKARPMTVREAARAGQALSGADAQALEAELARCEAQLAAQVLTD